MIHREVITMGEKRNKLYRGHEGVNPENNFLNHSTGEIINFDPETQVIKSKAQVNKQRANITARQNPWSWANMGNIKQFLADNKLSLTSLGAILVLSSSIGYDGYLRKQTKTDDCLTRTEIQKKLKLGEKTFDKLLKDLKDCGMLIAEGENRKKQVFKLNTAYHSVGKVEGNIQDLARVQKYGFNRLFEENNIKLDQIGFLYMLIPYLSYDNCTLVRDTKKPTNLTNALSVTELATELGMDKRTVNKYLKVEFNYQLKNGYYRMPVVALFRKPSEKKEMIIVNPVLFRRRKGFFDNVRYEELEEVFKSVSVKL